MEHPPIYYYIFEFLNKYGSQMYRLAEVVFAVFATKSMLQCGMSVPNNTNFGIIGCI